MVSSARKRPGFPSCASSCSSPFALLLCLLSCPRRCRHPPRVQPLLFLFAGSSECAHKKRFRMKKILPAAVQKERKRRSRGKRKICSNYARKRKCLCLCFFLFLCLVLHVLQWGGGRCAQYSIFVSPTGW